MFAKANTRTRIYLALVEGASFSRQGNAVFDLSTGTIVVAGGGSNGATGGSATIQNVGNGWYRCSYTLTLGGADTAIFSDINLVSTGTTISYTGDGTSGLFLFGAQLEAGAFATSVIPTTTTALTRSADVASVNTLSPWFNAAEGTLYVEGQSENATNDSGRLASINNGTAAERFELLYSSASEAQAIISDGNVTQASFTEAVTKTNVIKIALAYEINNSNASINGSSEATDTSCTMPTVTQLNIGSRQSASNPINGHIRRITYYPRRLSNAELQAITS